MIEVIGIDVDDTLCMTEEASFGIENEALRRIGRAPMSREVHLATWGQLLGTAILERSPGVDLEEFHGVYHPVIKEFLADGRLDAIPDENYAALDTLLEKGKKLVLLTSRTYDELQHMLAPDHLVAQRVSGFYHHSNTAYHKPDGRAFDELLRDFGIPANQCAYVGDSLGDAAASNEAGVHFIASLESGIRQPTDFARYKVASYLTKFPDIVEAVISLDDNAASV